MFTTFIAQPIFNLLVAIYALLPGHNLGLAIIIFTIIIRLLLWPLVKKQLHQTKIMRRVQPELKKIKAKTKGNRQLEAQMTMELYKERGIKPMASIGVLLLQLPILLGLYQGLVKLIDDPRQIYEFAYPFLQNLSWMQHISQNIADFDETLFGLVDLTRSVFSSGFYWPALILVAASAIVQFYASKQLLPQSKDAKGLRAILKDAGSGQQADQSDISAAVGKSTVYILPVFIFIIGVSLPSALALYWLVTSAVAYWQQGLVLKEDEEEMEQLADEPIKSKSSKKKSSKISEAQLAKDTKTTSDKSTESKKVNKKGSTVSRISYSTSTSPSKPKPTTKKTNRRKKRRR